MNKFIYLIPFCMVAFLLGMSSAINVGDILTQQQVNNINFSTVGLQCQQESSSVYIPTMTATVSFSCLFLADNFDGTFVIVRRYWDEEYSIFTFLQCRQQNSRAYCVAQAKTYYLNTFQSYKQIIRNDLIKFQTVTDLNGGDFNFTSGDLN